MAIDGKDTDVISVGDIGDTITVSTGLDLTSGVATLEIWIDRRDVSAGVTTLTNIAKLTAAVDGDPADGVIKVTTESPSPFTSASAEKWHEIRSYVKWTNDDEKKGDPTEKYVHRG